ncbi:hypothetical protein [Nostoc sp.]|uniref:hypothetical protein n=1 Tax=Nostoc sp. TaxID=1180 RepID=UPI002FF464A2
MTLTASRIEITPTEAALGAVITGFDVNSVEPEVILQLKQAWRDRHLLIFKNQILTDDQLLALSKGDLLYWDNQATAHLNLMLMPLVFSNELASGVAVLSKGLTI